MSVHALVDGLNEYDAGSEPPAWWDQSWEWNAEDPLPTSLSVRSVHPAGPVTVTDDASTSSEASSRSPDASPDGAATVVPFVTVEEERKAGIGAAVVKVESLETLCRPEASVLLTR